MTKPIFDRVVQTFEDLFPGFQYSPPNDEISERMKERKDKAKKVEDPSWPSITIKR